MELYCDYIDVYILLEGIEIIGWKVIEDLKDEVKFYEVNGDCVFYFDVFIIFVDLFFG